MISKITKSGRRHYSGCRTQKLHTVFQAVGCILLHWQDISCLFLEVHFRPVLFQANNVPLANHQQDCLIVVVATPTHGHFYLCAVLTLIQNALVDWKFYDLWTGLPRLLELDEDGETLYSSQCLASLLTVLLRSAALHADDRWFNLRNVLGISQSTWSTSNVQGFLPPHPESDLVPSLDLTLERPRQQPLLQKEDRNIQEASTVLPQLGSFLQLDLPRRSGAAIHRHGFRPAGGILRKECRQPRLHSLSCLARNLQLMPPSLLQAFLMPSRDNLRRHCAATKCPHHSVIWK
mmetsp:Transcript_39449/g.92783  ORF Transcript_39449/g.92783 Transcript_39449/m.92783 type:complete len:291 (-) Transcript_39449:504-1376(-)